VCSGCHTRHADAGFANTVVTSALTAKMTLAIAYGVTTLIYVVTRVVQAPFALTVAVAFPSSLLLASIIVAVLPVPCRSPSQFLWNRRHIRRPPHAANPYSVAWRPSVETALRCRLRRRHRGNDLRIVPSGIDQVQFPCLFPARREAAPCRL
jgi:hypothetical protein